MEQMKAIVLKARCIFNHTGRGLIMWLFWYWFHVFSSLMIRCDVFVSNFPIFLKKIAVLLFGFVCVVTQFWESLSISFCWFHNPACSQTLAWSHSLWASAWLDFLSLAPDPGSTSHSPCKNSSGADNYRGAHLQSQHLGGRSKRV